MSQSVRRRNVAQGNSRAQGSSATRRGAANVTARTNVTASWDDREAAERFSAAVIDFSAADLAKAARRTKAAAKGWKEASRAPGLSSTLNMAKNLPAVRKWLLHEMGEVAEYDDPRVLARAITMLQRAQKDLT